jgi:formate hydrogenlyase subunit 3/multisubunit Na+/H+ antiporter MnhD subunit
MLWILPTITIIFGAGFLDRYSWLRSSPQLIVALRLAGLLMLVTGGAFAAFQRNLVRIMAYGAIAETGFSILALSLDLKLGIPILFLLIIANLSTGAFPLLAGFPARLALWENLARDSIVSAVWMGIGVIGLLTSAFRSLAVISMAEEYAGWEIRETIQQRIMLGLGVIGLFLLGIFPQSVQYFLASLPQMFEHLGR